jgi:D-lactate dehydrogenase
MLMPEKYKHLKAALQKSIDANRLIDDPLRTLAYGTDASFYRLIPQLIVKVENEDEVKEVIRLAQQFETPVTFRAAGTSLSGQAISDSVLMVLSGDGWRDYRVSENAELISLQPGIIGSTANEYLAPFMRKIGPDPASINAAKIGGIAANNASGMCCGTAQNSYNTLAGMRMVLADGTVLDTQDSASVESFKSTHSEFLDELSQLANNTRSNSDLADKIRHKYRLKNTTGYSLNALTDFEDPIDILQHLMIGSEGTLGFISEITYKTVPDYADKATALVLFNDIEQACKAVAALKEKPVTAVELMDRAALHSVENKPGMPVFLKTLGEEVAALLVDVRAESKLQLDQYLDEVINTLDTMTPLKEVEFTFDPVSYQSLWNIRKGLFPAVGAIRMTGTTVIIEDIAFPVKDLAAGVRELQSLFKKYHYDEALIFGHALEGNLHFVFTQDFGTAEEVTRYQHLMDEVCELVVGGYGGSLKAEHGTGRNMAPFVEMEWGADAYKLMWSLKKLLDPRGLLNPGVILNEDPEIHLKNLKPLPAADDIVDKCIECGFCEAICPSRDLTLTPRQRIVSWREISRLKRSGEDPQRLQRLERDFEYQALDTCAVDGLCSTRCPVGIDTGKLTKKIRHSQRGDTAFKIGNFINRNFSLLEKSTRAGLSVAGVAQDVLGDKSMSLLMGGMNKISGKRIPQWNEAMPRSAGKLNSQSTMLNKSNGKVVYFPACVSRTMGPAKNDPHQDPLHERMRSLLEKAGYDIVIPTQVEKFCCGMPLESKGLPQQGNDALSQLEEAIWTASEEGRYPVLCDTSPCTLRMLEGFTKPLKVFEVVGFISKYLLPHLEFTHKVDLVSMHVTCTSRKMGLDIAMLDLINKCAREVFIPDEKGCCGFAGDKGFTNPEINASALKRLRKSIPAACHNGYSNSRTCEIGLTKHSGIPYQSIAYLVDQCTVAKTVVDESVSSDSG